MAIALYYSWTRLGRPLEPALPIREVVERMKQAFPRAANQNLFSWHADEAHYQSNRPQDHTPFSVDGWPLPNPQWFVFATDIMHRVDVGVDCHALFPYWLREAREGRMPWLKYIIWQAKIYDVRNDWRPQANSGHFDHIHLSARTDHRTTSLGSWSLLPPQEDDMSVADVRVGLAQLADEAANRSTPTGRQYADDLYAILRTAIPPQEVELSDDQMDNLADRVAARLRELRFTAE